VFRITDEQATETVPVQAVNLPRCNELKWQRYYWSKPKEKITCTHSIWI